MILASLRLRCALWFLDRGIWFIELFQNERFSDEDRAALLEQVATRKQEIKEKLGDHERR